MDNLRQEPWMKTILDEATIEYSAGIVDDPTILSNFLGGDMCSDETLLQRGKFLSILQQKHRESLNDSQYDSEGLGQ